MNSKQVFSEPQIFITATTKPPPMVICQTEHQNNRLQLAQAQSSTLGTQDSTGGSIKKRLAERENCNLRQKGRATEVGLCCTGKTRFHVALLGLAIAAVNCYAQATFCISIVEMVLPADYVIKEERDEHITKVLVVNGSAASTNVNSLPLQLMDDLSCPVEYKYRDYYDSWRFPINTNQSSASYGSAQIQSVSSSGNFIDVSNRFNWDASRQGLLLGAFAIGTAPLQVLGGRLAEIYGAKWVLLAGCVGTALTNLTVPLLAHFNFILLIMNRILMGVAQAGMEPGLMCLMAEWLAPSETGFFISMLLFAICIGFFLGSLGSSFILSLGYGWPVTYYIAGGVNLVVAIVWLIFASSRPRDSRLISSEELAFIEREQMRAKVGADDDGNRSGVKDDLNENDWKKDISLNSETSMNELNFNNMKLQHGNNNKENHHDSNSYTIGRAPWMSILSTPSVWAFIICKISIRWCADVLSIELPTYLANVLHLSIKLNGIINSVSSALIAICSFVTGYVVNEILKRQQQQQKRDCGIDPSLRETRISKTNLRKLCQSLASFGSAICVFLMTIYDCNILLSMSMLLLLSCLLVMGSGGELQIPYDMTSKYPGTLHGMACTLSVSGWLAPPLIGLILGDQPSSRYRWSIVWYLTALISLIGGLVFVLFADASPRDFDREANERDAKNRRRAKRRRNQEAAISFQTTVNSQKFADEHRFMQEERIGRCLCFPEPDAGYYNEACKPSDDSSPLAPSSRRRTESSTQPTAITNNNSSESLSNAWSPYFDRELIRIRQVEESFVKPSYLNNYCHLDSIATSKQTTMFPYRTKDKSIMRHEGDGQSLLRRLTSHIRRKFQTLNGSSKSTITSLEPACKLPTGTANYQLGPPPANQLVSSVKAPKTITHL